MNGSGGRTGTTQHPTCGRLAQAVAYGMLLSALIVLGARPALTSPVRSPQLVSKDRGSAQPNLREAPPTLIDAINRAKLTAPDGAAFDYFGDSVAVDGDTAMVGASMDDTPSGTDAGSAHVFVRSGTTWTEQAHLTAPDGAAFDSFGVSVAVDGDTAVVGAYLDDTPGGSDAGSAYVFVRSGTTWTEQAHLSAPDAEFNDNFGLPVAVDGDTAVVGAESGDSPTVADSGAAYVFVRLGTTWTAQDKLTAPDAERSDLFSSSLAVSGDTAVVGASHDATPAGFEAGSAYVFVRSGSAWTPQAHLTAPDAEVGDDFGRSVGVSGDTAVVGAFADNTPAGTDAGSAYVFVRSGSAWTPQSHLTAPDADIGDLFGVSVAVDRDTAVVGAEAHDTLGGTDAGSAYVFVRSGTAWTAQAYLVAPDGAASDFFGYSVGVSGHTAVVGADYDDTPAGTDAGSAYVFWR